MFVQSQINTKFPLLYLTDASQKSATPQKVPQPKPKKQPQPELNKQPAPLADTAVTNKPSVATEASSRDRDHIFDTLNLHREGILLDGDFVKRSIEKMKKIYHKAIGPMAEAYKFQDMGDSTLSGTFAVIHQFCTLQFCFMTIFDQLSF